MKRLALAAMIIVSIMLVASCAGAPEESKAAPLIAPVPDSANIQQFIIGLEREWVAAILAKDAAVIDRLLADDFVGTTNDQKYFKQDAIADVKEGAHESLMLDKIEVRVYGDTAIATMDQEEKSHHDNEDFSGKYLFTDVWVKLNGQWKAVASHGSRAR
jgi:ketosteroid isomerase-like protein